MRFRFLIGYFRGGVFNLPISVDVRRDKVVSSPSGLSRFLRVGTPYVELTSDELIDARSVRYSPIIPLSAIELRYQKDGREGGFVIGFLWHRRRFIDALRSSGIRVKS